MASTGMDTQLLERLVRRVGAYLDGTSVSEESLEQVCDMFEVHAGQRTELRRALEQVGVVIQPTPKTEPQSEYRQVQRPARKEASADRARAAGSPSLDAEGHARALLEDDLRNTKPWNRILTAVEEVGLATIMREGDGNLAEDLPQGFRKSLKAHDERARAFDAFMLHNRRLVWKLAQRHLEKGLEFDDLEQTGYKGLHRAIEKFDASQGHKFSTYATHWINQAMQRAIADEGRLIRLPVYVHEQMVKVLAARNRLLTENGKAPLLDIANKAGVTPDEALKALLLSAGVVSLDAPINEGGTTRGEMIAQDPRADGPVDPETHVIAEDECGEILEAIESLDSREATILKLRFGFSDDDPKTLDEIGVRIGVTRERIRQIEKLAKEKVAEDLRRRGLG